MKNPRVVHRASTFAAGRFLASAIAGARRFVAVALLGVGVAIAAPEQLDADPAALAAAMTGRRIVVLGEVHDNAAQHALRFAALKLLVARGVRPALAFEQFDRERQGDIDRARRERPGDVDYLIAQAKGAPGWQWDFYRPFIALALAHDLPIVAADLSRADAMAIGRGGTGTLRDAKLREWIDGRALPAGFAATVEAAVAAGHCDLLPAQALPPIARAQIARDATLAYTILPFADRGVVLLTGNGHARNDVGVPFWLGASVHAATISVGLLEAGGSGEDNVAEERFDAYVITAPAPREDPCLALAKQMGR
jgi:uncharacterized iron-regulated protein